MNLIVDPEAMSLILALSHTFVEFDGEIFLPSFYSFHQLKKGCVSYKQRYVHEILANPLVKLD